MQVHGENVGVGDVCLTSNRVDYSVGPGDDVEGFFVDIFYRVCEGYANRHECEIERDESLEDLYMQGVDMKLTVLLEY